MLLPTITLLPHIKYYWSSVPDVLKCFNTYNILNFIFIARLSTPVACSCGTKEWRQEGRGRGLCLPPSPSPYNSSEKQTCKQQPQQQTQPWTSFQPILISHLLVPLNSPGITAVASQRACHQESFYTVIYSVQPLSETEIWQQHLHHENVHSLSV